VSEGSINTVLCRAAYFTNVRQANDFLRRHEGKGHHGMFEGPGCKAIRAGLGGRVREEMMRVM